MFEKEAKERARKLEESQTLGVYDSDEDYARDSGWNDGEVAGYEEGFKDGAEFGYNKANEWHFVKDELPPVKKEYNNRSELVLVLSKEKEMQYAQYVEKEKTWARGICEINFEPYAWKEIVLPEEIKELKKNLKRKMQN